MKFSTKCMSGQEKCGLLIQSSTITNLNKNEIVNSFNHKIYFCWHHL
jgi:hypothetical protein